MKRPLRLFTVSLAVALAAGCSVSVNPTIVSGGRASPKPAGPEAKASPAAKSSPKITPHEGPSGLPSDLPPAAKDDRPEAWLDDQPPFITENGPARLAAWTRLEPATGIELYLNERRESQPDGSTLVQATADYRPDPADVKVTLTVPPDGAPVTIEAYEVSYTYTTFRDQADGKAPTVIGPQRVPIAPVLVPVGSATRAGAPVAIDVPLGNRQLVQAFLAGPDDAPAVVVATIAFMAGDGTPVSGLDLNPLRAVVPIRGVFGDKPPAGPPAARVAPAALALPTAAAGAPASLAIAGIAPAAGLTLTLDRKQEEVDGIALLTTDLALGPDADPPVVYLAAPPGGKGMLLGAYELRYVYDGPADSDGGTLGPQRVEIPPTWVGPGQVVGIPVPVNSLALRTIAGRSPSFLKAVAGFLDVNGLPVLDAQRDAIQATIPFTLR